MQMDVHVDAVTEPIKPEQRVRLRKLEQFTWPAGSVAGSGPAYILTHQANASFKAINQILDSGGRVAFAATESETAEGKEKGAMIISGIDHDRLARIARENSLAIKSLAAAPADSLLTRKPRVGLYRAWVPVIDEGWTRWILENFDFAPQTLRNGDIQAGRLRDR